jgi:hypothetical protein
MQSPSGSNAKRDHRTAPPPAVSQGQRPERVTKYAHFLNRSFYGTPPTAYDVLVLVLNDGTEKEVYTLLHEAMQAWDRELARRQL